MTSIAPDQELEELRISKEQAEASVNLWKAFEGLRQDKRFQSLIEESYLKQESARLVLLLAEPSFQTDERRKQVMDAMMGISTLNQYFNSIVQIGSMAQESLNDHEQMEDELLEEDEVA